MSTLNPQSPTRADYRFLKKLISSTMGGKVEDRPEDFDKILDAFKKMDGSWEGVFKGSEKDILLLKTIVKVMFKKGLLTKSPDWSVKDVKTES